MFQTKGDKNVFIEALREGTVGTREGYFTSIFPFCIATFSILKKKNALQGFSKVMLVNTVYAYIPFDSYSVSPYFLIIKNVTALVICVDFNEILPK